MKTALYPSIWRFHGGIGYFRNEAPRLFSITLLEGECGWLTIFDVGVWKFRMYLGYSKEK